MIVLSFSLSLSDAHTQMPRIYIEWIRGHFSHKKISHVINLGCMQYRLSVAHCLLEHHSFNIIVSCFL